MLTSYKKVPRQLMKFRRVLNAVLLASVLISAGTNLAYSQDRSSDKPSKYSITRNRDMFVGWLSEMKKAFESDYYDRNYKGIDLDAKFDAAKARINSLDYDWQMLRVLVQVAMDFNDSHTRIFPPPPKYHYDYGFSMQIFGRDCLINMVKPGSDASKKGLEVGDQVLKVGRFEPSRANLWQIRYVINSLDPKDTVELTVKKNDGTSQTLNVTAASTLHAEYLAQRNKLISKQRDDVFRCSELSSEVMTCKLFSFSVTKGDIDKMFKAIGAHSKLILDLRGNGGGFVEIEEYLTSYFFDRSVKIADLKTRKKTEARVAKGRGPEAFKGDLVVLVDSASASASEVFSRVIQIEKRGKVVGDVTAGAVMTSNVIGLHKVDPYGFDETPYPLGMNMTIADVIMSDGGRLEDSGVIPDLPIVPAGVALAKGEDPVLAVAAGLHGVKISPEAAGQLKFLFEGDRDGP